MIQFDATSKCAVPSFEVVSGPVEPRLVELRTIWEVAKTTDFQHRIKMALTRYCVAHGKIPEEVFGEHV